MATLEFTYFSAVLHQYAVVNVILPEIPKKQAGCGNVEGTYKTLYLFHGLGGNHNVWLRGTNIERYARDCGIAVVMPEVGRTWYTDTAYGAKYFTFVSEELPAVCRSYFKGMSDKREDNFVGGLSMGGYGAVKVALRCADKFGGCIALSGALDPTRTGRVFEREYWHSVFGIREDICEIRGTDNDLFALLDKAEIVPRIFLWCGTEDALLPANRDFAQKLAQKGAEHLYTESEGDHTWKWWDKHIQAGLEYLLI